MTDIIIRDIAPALAQRIKRIGEARGWSETETLQRLLEAGLHSCERTGAPPLNEREAGALVAAINALEQVPNDPGFALIGREAGPDQAG